MASRSITLLTSLLNFYVRVPVCHDQLCQSVWFWSWCSTNPIVVDATPISVRIKSPHELGCPWSKIGKFLDLFLLCLFEN